MPRLGLGGSALAGLFRPVEERDARATVERAWQAGIRYFDVAPLYGYGVAEERVGRVLASHPRDSFVLSTKVGRLVVPGKDQSAWVGYQGGSDRHTVFDFGRDGVLRSLDESLARLGTDAVDLVYVHDPDEHMDRALAEAYPTLLELRDQGVVRAIGVGSTRVATLLRFVRETQIDACLVAGRHTLIDRTAAAELLPLCEEQDVTVVAGGVLNSGLLAGPGADATFDYKPAGPDELARARKVWRTCERAGVSPLAAALQFPLRHPAVGTMLLGPRSVAELETSLGALGTPLPESLWGHLELAIYASL